MKSLIVFSSYLLAFTCTAAAKGGNLVNLDFDNQIRLSLDGREISSFSGKVISKSTIDPGTNLNFNPYIASHGCLTPPHCLTVSMGPSNAGAVKNKIMFPIWRHNQKSKKSQNIAIGDGKTNIVRFGLKLDKSYQDPTNNLVHFQVFQPRDQKKPYHGSIIPGGPIISLKMVPYKYRKVKKSNVQEFVVAVRNKETGKSDTYNYSDKSIVYRGIFQKNKWYEFEIIFKSIADGPDVGGPITVSINKKVVMRKNIQWGFSPSHFPVSRFLGLDLGIYRSADRRGYQTIYFDNINFDQS